MKKLKWFYIFLVILAIAGMNAYISFSDDASLIYTEKLELSEEKYDNLPDAAEKSYNIEEYEDKLNVFLVQFFSARMKQAEFLLYCLIYFAGMVIITMISGWIEVIISSVIFMICIFSLNTDIFSIMDLGIFEWLGFFLVFVFYPIANFVNSRQSSKLKVSSEIFQKDYEKLKNRYSKLNEGHKQIVDDLKSSESKASKISSSFTSFRSLAREIASSLEVDKVANTLFEVLVKLLKAKKGELFIFDESTMKLKYAKSFGWSDTGHLEGLEILLGETVIGWVAQNGKMYSRYESNRDYNVGSIPQHPSISSALVAPLKMGNDVIGVINIDDLSQRPTSEEIRNLDAFASLTALSVSNARMFEHIKEMADIDNLTKLYVNRYFQEHAFTELKRSSRYGEVFSLAMTDIDHFKNFNDTYGHQIGDFVLKETAGIIKQSVREGIDLAARYGGEEFIVMLPKTDPEGAYVFAERLRIAIEEKVYYCDDITTGEKMELKVTMSIGLATFPEHGSTIKDLVKKADDALYEAKETGRNKVCLAPN
ncbi:sensor domain-containing diguanylate cyclase [bacterium]|nr:sensor domain-containing diguanylate cyclase [bacterium]